MAVLWDNPIEIRFLLKKQIRQYLKQTPSSSSPYSTEEYSTEEIDFQRFLIEVELPREQTRVIPSPADCTVPYKQLRPIIGFHISDYWVPSMMHAVELIVLREIFPHMISMASTPSKRLLLF
mmetsp:Transcript_4028/g.6053  ORF Transcript_4028/g.6053 Transcript_4028/m.6053 type:complete len:122 (+) Transcript_4028:1089-1454(+)